MKLRSSPVLLFSLLLAVVVVGCTQQPQTSAETLPATLESFIDRLKLARGQLPQIIAAAEAAAGRKIKHPDALLNLTYSLQPSFAEEMLNRSGGLAGALPSDERRGLITDHDIVIFSIRSWEKNGPKGIEYLNQCRQKGWITILFASQAGKPADLQVDFFIDNGAAGPGEDEGPVNLIANALNGWLWVCEYTAALTRQGQHPGFLQSITVPGSYNNNKIYQARRTRHLFYPSETAIPAETLARIYLSRVDRLIEDLSSSERIAQINYAGKIISERINSGRNVYVSTNTHIMLDDIQYNNKVPFKALNALRKPQEVFGANLKPGDLLFWLSFNGVDIWWFDRDGSERLYTDYQNAIRQTGADFITCFATDPLHPGNAGQGALAHIEQNWDFGDAVVPVPFPPGRIAPISGLCQALIYRMLDETAAGRLK